MATETTITFANFGPTLITRPLLPSSYPPGFFLPINISYMQDKWSLILPYQKEVTFAFYLLPQTLAKLLTVVLDLSSCQLLLLLVAPPPRILVSVKPPTSLSLSDLLQSKGFDGLEISELKHFKSLSFWMGAFPCLMYDYSSNSSSNSFSRTILLKK